MSHRSVIRRAERQQGPADGELQATSSLGDWLRELSFWHQAVGSCC